MKDVILDASIIVLRCTAENSYGGHIADTSVFWYYGGQYCYVGDSENNQVAITNISEYMNFLNDYEINIKKLNRILGK